MGGATYFARVSGLSGELGDTIANEVSRQGLNLVESKDTDVAFESSGPGEWSLVDDPHQAKVGAMLGAVWSLVSGPTPVRAVSWRSLKSGGQTVSARLPNCRLGRSAPSWALSRSNHIGSHCRTGAP